MFKISLICVGKFKEKSLATIEQEYIKRLKPYAKFSITELPEEAYGKRADTERVKLEEASKILKHMPKEAIVVLMDEKGQERSSEEFAAFLERLGSLGQEIVFIIGGGLGLHSSLKTVSNYQISLSKLTFPHNLARIFLEEQVYRACTIITGHPYHKT